MFGYLFVIPSSRASHSNPTTRLTVHFGSAMIDTAVTRDATVVDDWVRAANLRGARLIVGLDCEWKRNFSWTTSKVSVLLLCAGTHCLVLQLFYVDRIPASIRSFLADPDVLFVGIGVVEDVAKMNNDYGLTCAAHVDLESRCKDYLGRYTGGRKLSLKGFAREVSNWEKHHLSLDCEWKATSYRSCMTTTSKAGRRSSSSSAPRRHPLPPLATALRMRHAVNRMGCPRPREGSEVTIVFVVLLFLLAGQVLPGVSSHPSPTVAAKHHQAVHVGNKLLNKDTRATGSNSHGAVAVASVDLCSEEVVELSQSSVSSLPNGIPSYGVTITNTCLDCTVSNVHVSCGEFASTELVDPSDFQRLSYDDCLVKNGGPIGPMETISFDYSNSFMYKMNVATVSCGDI